MRRVRGREKKSHKKKSLLMLKTNKTLKPTKRRLRLTLTSTTDMKIKARTVEATAILGARIRTPIQIDLTNLISKIDNLILRMRAQSTKDGKQIDIKKKYQNTTTKRKQLLTMSIQCSKDLWPKQKKSSFVDSQSLIHL